MRLVSPGRVQGSVSAPSSKSMMQRAVAAATLTKGETVIHKPSFCDDAVAALRIAESLGAKIQREKDYVVMNGAREVSDSVLQCGESGLSFRLFAAISGLFNVPLTFIRQGSLLERPFDFTPLEKLGAQVRSSPSSLTIQGPIRGGDIEVDGSITSQFISGLLMALPLCKEDSTLRVSNLTSAPYIKMTLSVLREFGIEIESSEGFFKIPGKQEYKACDYTVEGDWSGGSFLLVLGAIAGSVTVDNLSPSSFQGDRAIVEVLIDSGAQVTNNKNSWLVSSNHLKAFEFDATSCPDLFPPLVALAINAEGTSAIRGVSRLKFKESNRGDVLCREFSKLGGKLEIREDTMLITGSKLMAGEVSSHNDHRIAMALSIAAKTALGPVRIDNPECVSKSYPDFYDVLGSFI